MNENVSIDGEVDAGWTSYYNPKKHGQMSKTIGGTTEDDKGELKTEWWPSEIEADPSELNETQTAVIRYVVLNDVSDMSLQAISKAATPDMSEVYANSVLNSHWPEKHKELVESNNSETKVSAEPDLENSRVIGSVEELAEIRQRALDGETSGDIAEDYDVHKSTIRKYLNGRRGGECEIPPLEWAGDSRQAYVLPEDNDTGHETNDAQEEPKPCGEYHPLPCGLDKACAFESKGNQTDVESIQTESPIDTLRTALDAIEATAQTDETKEAINHLRGLL